MRLSPLSIASALLLSMSLMTVVTAQSTNQIITCTSRMPSLERAACLAKQHQEIVQMQAQTAPPVAAPPAGSSSPNILSCSRLSGVDLGQCLAKQHKQIMEMLSLQPVVTTAPAVAGPARPVCFRFSDRVKRLECLKTQPSSR